MYAYVTESDKARVMYGMDTQSTCTCTCTTLALHVPAFTCINIQCTCTCTCMYIPVYVYIHVHCTSTLTGSRRNSRDQCGMQSTHTHSLTLPDHVGGSNHADGQALLSLVGDGPLICVHATLQLVEVSQRELDRA